MIPKLQRKWRLPMCLCGVSLSVAVLYLCAHEALGQIPPGGGYGGPTVEFVDSNYYVAEGNSAVIGVTLNGSSIQPVSVFYSTSNGSGQVGVDYTPASGTLTFPPGTTMQTFNVTTMNDPENTSWVTVNLTLSSPSGATLGSPSTATLYIINPNACPSY